MKTFDIKEIMDTIPHRYPFLMIDKVLELRVGEYAKAIKNVSMNEPFFQGHYPGNPIMPGVLVIEGIAQTASFLGLKTFEGDTGDKQTPLFAGIDKARFKLPVFPGDVLTYEVTVKRRRRTLWWLTCTASVDGKIVCKADMQAAFMKPE